MADKLRGQIVNTGPAAFLGAFTGSYTIAKIYAGQATTFESITFGTRDSAGNKISSFKTTNADDDGITLNILVSGDSDYGESIVFAHDNLPLTIKGLLMDRIKLTGGGGDDDAITVLSFH